MASTTKKPPVVNNILNNKKGTKLKDIREVGEAIEDSPPKIEEETIAGEGGAALTEEQILGLI